MAMWLLVAVFAAEVEESLVQAVRTAHKANLDNLRFGSIKFKVVFAEPPTLELARKREYVPKFVSQRGLYLFD